MKMNLRPATVLCAILLVSACGSESDKPTAGDYIVDNPYDGLWQDSPEVPFRFVLEQTFGVEEEPEEATLSSVGWTVTDHVGNVYLLEGRSGQLVSFDANGAFRWRTGREGDGPGEFQNAHGLVWNGEDRLFVGNQRTNRLEVFDLDGQFVKSHPLSRLDLRSALLVGVLRPDQPVFRMSDMEAFGIYVNVVSLADDPSIVTQLRLDLSDGVDYPPTGSPNSYLTVIDDEIVVGHASEYQFDFYDGTGTLNRVVTRAIDHLVRPGILRFGDIATTRFFSTLAAPLELHNGFRLVYASWPTNIDDPDAFGELIVRREAPEIQSERTYDLFDENWRLLYSWSGITESSQRPGHIYHADSEGNLYIRMRETFPQLGRYRVEVTPPN